MLSLLQLSVAALVSYLLYGLYWELTVGAARRKLAKERGCQPVPAIPDRDPFFGLGIFFESRRAIKEHRFLDSVFQRYKYMGVNTFSMKLLGAPVITTIEPENLKHIQALDFKNWSLGERRIRTFTPFLGPGIFTTNGAEWAHSREMLRPNFVRSQVGDLQTFETHVGHLIDAIPRDGSTVDLGDLFFRLTIDSATEFLFGESTNCLAPGTSTVSSSKFAVAFNRGQEAIAQHGRLGRFGHLMTSRQFKEDTKYVHEFVDTFVYRALHRRASGTISKDRYIFADAIAAQTNDTFQIRSELLNILLAGRDTTASLLSNAFHTLARRPDIWQKLREEITSTLGPDALSGSRATPPTFAELKEMKYLRALLNESLRLYPVVPGNAREALNDTVLPLGGGPDGKSPIFVAKGTTVSWSVWTMHRRKDFYGEDSCEFKPERWLGEKGLRPGWEYLPFNGGARICLGQQFALTEASYCTVRLLQSFEKIENRDDRPWTEWLTLTCTGLHGARVGLVQA